MQQQLSKQHVKVTYCSRRKGNSQKEHIVLKNYTEILRKTKGLETKCSSSVISCAYTAKNPVWGGYRVVGGSCVEAKEKEQWNGKGGRKIEEIPGHVRTHAYTPTHTNICTHTHVFPFIIKDNWDYPAQSGTSKSSCIFIYPAYLLVAVFYTTESRTSGLEPHYF